MSNDENQNKSTYTAEEIDAAINELRTFAFNGGEEPAGSPAYRQAVRDADAASEKLRSMLRSKPLTIETPARRDGASIHAKNLLDAATKRADEAEKELKLLREVSKDLSACHAADGVLLSGELGWWEKYTEKFRTFRAVLKDGCRARPMLVREADESGLTAEEVQMFQRFVNHKNPGFSEDGPSVLVKLARIALGKSKP